MKLEIAKVEAVGLHPEVAIDSIGIHTPVIIGVVAGKAGLMGHEAFIVQGWHPGWVEAQQGGFTKDAVGVPQPISPQARLVGQFGFPGVSKLLQLGSALALGTMKV